ncbi:hypothetical protein C0Q70_07254 [Pomacea canaliculata]|uniref:Uncharacterized protein n=1 Tax=Pomacea canaliculata TaxID=400727 RepID=A0A2T7PEJ5_POMCA|nr:hypothetical protein C0Q70_07254 [Pomacea canaliculata]
MTISHRSQCEVRGALLREWEREESEWLKAKAMRTRFLTVRQSADTHRCEGGWSVDEVRWCRSVITCLVQQVSRCRCSRRTPPLGQQALA